MTKTIFVLDADLFGYSLVRIGSEEDSLGREIDWGFDNLVVLPTNLGSFIVLRMRKVKYRGYFLDVEN